MNISYLKEILKQGISFFIRLQNLCFMSKWLFFQSKQVVNARKKSFLYKKNPINILNL